VIKQIATTLCVSAAMAFFANVAGAVELRITGTTSGKFGDALKQELAEFEEATGNTVTVIPLPWDDNAKVSQFRLWLSSRTKDIDVYSMEYVWVPAFADHFIDLTDVTKDVLGNYFPATIKALTFEGKLLGLPRSADGPLLFYRKDLLEKHGKTPPKTWDELAATAKEIQEKERAAGNLDMWGFVFQGKSNENLTCEALEWIKSSGGGNIVEPDGTISINNENAAAALERAKGWIGTISPPGVLSYEEEDARGLWQSGNAVFMRNWTYVYGLSNADDSPIKGKLDVVPLPADSGEMSAPAFGARGLLVSKYSEHQKEAIELVKFLASKQQQKDQALQLAVMPTIPSLYDDTDVISAQPFMSTMKTVVESGALRPSGATRGNYNEASNLIWTAVYNTLAGKGTASENLEQLEAQLTDLKGDGW